MMATKTNEMGRRPGRAARGAGTPSSRDAAGSDRSSTQRCGRGRAARRALDLRHSADRLRTPRAAPTPGDRAGTPGPGSGVVSSQRSSRGSWASRSGRLAREGRAGAVQARASWHPTGNVRPIERGGGPGRFEGDRRPIAVRAAFRPGRGAGEHQGRDDQQDGRGQASRRRTAGSTGIHPASELARMRRASNRSIREEPGRTRLRVLPSGSVYSGFSDGTSVTTAIVPGLDSMPTVESTMKHGCAGVFRLPLPPGEGRGEGRGTTGDFGSSARVRTSNVQRRPFPASSRRERGSQNCRIRQWRQRLIRFRSWRLNSPRDDPGGLS